MEKKEHEFCLRCGRRLKKLQARELGYGPVCWQKIQIQSAGKKLFEEGAVNSSVVQENSLG